MANEALAGVPQEGQRTLRQSREMFCSSSEQAPGSRAGVGRGTSKEWAFEKIGEPNRPQRRTCMQVPLRLGRGWRLENLLPGMQLRRSQEAGAWGQSLEPRQAEGWGWRGRRLGDGLFSHLLWTLISALFSSPPGLEKRRENIHSFGGKKIPLLHSVKKKKKKNLGQQTSVPIFPAQPEAGSWSSCPSMGFELSRYPASPGLLIISAENWESEILLPPGVHSVNATQWPVTEARI